MSIVERFLHQVRQRPNATSVACADGRVSYGALGAVVAGLASHLRREGAARVLIALPQGAHAYAAMLASLAAGATYAPLNVSAPEQRRHAIARAFRPDLVIAETADPGLLAAAPGARLLVPAEIDALATEGERCPVMASDAPAYVIFTSGSTGTPKGVVIGRGALSHYVDWIAGSLRVAPSDRISQYANIAFDLSVLEIYGALCFGASLHPVRAFSDRMRPARMIARDGLTLWISVPSVLGLMRQAGELTPALLGSVRRFVFCGEALPAHDAEALLRAAPDAELQNTYGPTEATVSMTSVVLRPDTLAAASRGSVALGAPIPGMGLQLAPDGEIVLTGPQLADGYLDDPAGTARAFRTVATPDGPVRGYFTGDRAERHDGHVFFGGRRDFQIKHKGFRIETGDIAAAFLAAGHASVYVFQAEGRLVAAIEGAPVQDEAALRRALAARLDAYAVPDTLLFLPTLPRSANDKVDRAAILALHAGGRADPREPSDAMRPAPRRTA